MDFYWIETKQIKEKKYTVVLCGFVCVSVCCRDRRRQKRVPAICSDWWLRPADGQMGWMFFSLIQIFAAHFPFPWIIHYNGCRVLICERVRQLEWGLGKGNCRIFIYLAHLNLATGLEIVVSWGVHACAGCDKEYQSGLHGIVLPSLCLQSQLQVSTDRLLWVLRVCVHLSD